jgi:hypothetical protein
MVTRRRPGKNGDNTNGHTDSPDESGEPRRVIDDGKGQKTYRCPVDLSDHEMAALAEEQGKLNLKAEDLRNKKREGASIFTGQIKDIEKKLSEIAQSTSTRKAMRDVPVREELDAPNKLVRIVRIDTGEKVAERAATTKDLQTQIPGS